MSDTLSSFNTEQDNSFIESAMSLVKRNPKRAAILTARKIRAVELDYIKMPCHLWVNKRKKNVSHSPIS